MKSTISFFYHILSLVIFTCFSSHYAIITSADTFIETFEIDTANLAETQLAYPDIAFLTNGARVTDGVLYLNGSTGQYADFTVSSGDIEVSCQLGAIGTPVWSPTGITLGDYRIAFHPGYSGGGFFIELKGVGKVVPNQNMGFTPSQGVLHDVSVVVDTSDHIFDINAAGYRYQFDYDSGHYIPGMSTLGVVCHSYTTGIFDNFSVNNITIPPPQPDPIDPDDPPSELSRYEFVVGIQPSLEWTPLEVGFRAGLHIPGLPSFDYENSVSYPEHPITPSIEPWEYSFKTNSTLLGKTLQHLAPIEQNLIGADGALGIRGGIDISAGIELDDGESGADVEVNAELGVYAYAVVEPSGRITRLPVIGNALPDDVEVSVPIWGVPAYELDVVRDIPIGHTFDYFAYKSLLGIEEVGDFTVSVEGVQISFDDDEREIHAGVGAEAVVFAETNATMDVDFYFREVDESSAAGPMLTKVSDGWVTPVDLSQTYVTSPSGDVQLDEEGVLTMTTGSAVWISSQIEVVEEADVLAFNAIFDGNDLGEGVLSIYMDGELVALIDESDAGYVLDSYFFALENPIGPGVHTVSFRMDPEDSETASVIISDLGTAFADIPEIFPGDANYDGAVGVSDLGILATNYGIGNALEWTDGDFTGDGVADVSDLGILATYYGIGATQAVPEPTGIVLLVCGLAGLLGRTRRRW